MTGCIHPRDINMTFEQSILETLAMMRNIKIADIHIEFISNYFSPEQIILACRKQGGLKLTLKAHSFFIDRKQIEEIKE